MKSISLILAVAITILSFSMQQSSAAPSISQPEPQQMENEVPRPQQYWNAALTEEAHPEEVLLRTKRQSHLSLCRYCCHCCKNKGCGFCCKF